VFHAGETYFEAWIIDLLTEATPGQTIDDCPSVQSLHEREREVFTLLGQGYMPQAIAGRMQINTGTVSSHCKHLLIKFGISSVAALRLYATGLINKFRRRP
jgi:DNA-binding CsgD family transcriptional regulator